MGGAEQMPVPEHMCSVPGPQPGRQRDRRAAPALPAAPLVPALRPLPVGCRIMGSQQLCDPGVPVRPSFSPYTSSSDAVTQVDTA